MNEIRRSETDEILNSSQNLLLELVYDDCDGSEFSSTKQLTAAVILARRQ